MGIGVGISGAMCDQPDFQQPSVLLSNRQGVTPKNATENALVVSQQSPPKSLRQSSSFHQQPIKLATSNNEQHIISIFDKDTDKSYLLER